LWCPDYQRGPLRSSASPSTAAGAARRNLTIERDRADLYITVAENGDPDSCNINECRRTAR
jgi:hypothetical protein